MNQLTFSNPIAVPPLKHIAVELATDIDDKRKSLALVLRLYGDGPVMHPEQFRLRVSNESGCDSIELNDNPGTLLAVVRHGRVIAQAPAAQEDGETPPLPANTRVVPAVAHAFELVMGAYIQAQMQGHDGNDAIMTTLVALTLIPPGVVG